MLSAPSRAAPASIGKANAAQMPFSPASDENAGQEASPPACKSLTKTGRRLSYAARDGPSPRSNSRAAMVRMAVLDALATA